MPKVRTLKMNDDVASAKSADLLPTTFVVKVCPVIFGDTL